LSLHLSVAGGARASLIRSTFRIRASARRLSRDI
jgi:hypothetical protein